MAGSHKILSMVAAHLFACGKTGLPCHLQVAGRRYNLKETFKHDFFAATGMYVSDLEQNNSSDKIVVKLGRRQCFCGIPLGWLGRWLTRRELKTLRRIKHLNKVPHVLSKIGKSGFAYRYIEGVTLDHKPILGDSFFDELDELLGQIHKENIVCLDMNKRGNIILGCDGHPYIIDFQISVHIGKFTFGIPALSAAVSRALQHEDLYHIYKHKRKHQPHLMRPEEIDLSRKRSWLIRAHRFMVRPIQIPRRALLRSFYENGLLDQDPTIQYSTETDPARFAK